MGSVMKMALPVAAIGAPFMFPGLAAGLGGAGALGAGAGGLGGLGAMFPGAAGSALGAGAAGSALTGLAGAAPIGVAAPFAGFGSAALAGAPAGGIGLGAMFPGAASAMAGGVMPAFQGALGGGNGLFGNLFDNMPDFGMDQLQGLMPQQQQEEQPPPPQAMPAIPMGLAQQGGDAPSLADAAFGGSYNATGGYYSPPTADMLEQPAPGFYRPLYQTMTMG